MKDLLKGTVASAGPSFSLSNRFRRAVWNLVYHVMFRLSPVFFHEWRSILLRLFGAEIGKGCHIYPRAAIWAPWNLKTGDFVGIADDVKLYNQAEIVIGDLTVISQGSHICTGTHDYQKKAFPVIIKPVTIGKRAWICADAFIHPGVSIGEGAVVGARSVVTRDIKKWTVCAGNPCTEIRKRNVI